MCADRRRPRARVRARAPALASGRLAGARTGQVDEPELADLHLVAPGQGGDVDRLAVDVGAVEAADVVHGEPAALAVELDVPAADRDVVEEDVAVGVPAGGGDVLVEQEPAAGVGAALDHQQGRARGQRLDGAGVRVGRASATSGWSLVSSPPTLGITLVDSPTRSGESAEPHCAQKRLPSGFSWPHRVQCTLRLLRYEGPAAGLGTAAGGRRTTDRTARRGSAAAGCGGPSVWNQPVGPRVNRKCRVRNGGPRSHRGPWRTSEIIVIAAVAGPSGGPLTRRRRAPGRRRRRAGRRSGPRPRPAR